MNQLGNSLQFVILIGWPIPCVSAPSRPIIDYEVGYRCQKHERINCNGISTLVCHGYLEMTRAVKTSIITVGKVCRLSCVANLDLGAHGTKYTMSAFSLTSFAIRTAGYNLSSSISIPVYLLVTSKVELSLPGYGLKNGSSSPDGQWQRQLVKPPANVAGDLSTGNDQVCSYPAPQGCVSENKHSKDQKSVTGIEDYKNSKFLITSPESELTCYGAML